MNKMEQSTQIAPRILQIIASLMLIAAVFDAFYWFCYLFFPEIVQSYTEKWYLTYEDSFPLADVWLGIALLIASIYLLRFGTNRNIGPFFSMISGALLLYLGLLDLLFNVNNDIFSTFGLEQAIEATIVVFCLLYGPFLIIFFWKNHFRFLERV